MLLSATEFTPEVLLSAPRKSPATANFEGTHAIFTVSSYSFQSHTESNEIRILDLQSGRSTLFSNNAKAHDPCWLGEENEIIWLQDADHGFTELHLANGNTAEESYLVGKFSGPVSNLKIKKLTSGTIAIAVTGKATQNGGLYNPKDEILFYSQSTIWYSTLHQTEENGSCKYVLSTSGPIDALQNVDLECPRPPFGGLQDFDISSSGISLVVQNPANAIDPTKLPRTLLYYIPRSTFTEDPPHKLHLVDVPGASGDSSYPVFSPNGEYLAFLRSRNAENEYDSYRVAVTNLVRHESKVIDVLGVEGRKGRALLSAQSIYWNKNRSKVYTIATENGRGSFFQLMSSISDVSRPLPITSDGTVINVSPCGLSGFDDRLLITSSSFIDSCLYTLIDPDTKASRLLSSTSENGLKFGLSPSQISEFWFPGVADTKIHALVMKPSDFDQNKRYPLALLLHGGPVAAWMESWSTRWNPAVFAEKGYVIVMPNLTGSLGYGQEFIEAIYNNWGGNACIELVHCLEQLKSVPFIDCTRSIALGGSYGGYLINWIAGQPLAKEFRAMVCHDGVSSVPCMYACDQTDFDVSLGGPLWDREAKANFDRWDPAQYTDKWTTPTLFVHSDMDYNLPITQGLAPYTILQRKGVDSMFLNFANEGHWVLKPENSLVWHKVLFEWMDKHTKPKNDSGVDSAK